MNNVSFTSKINFVNTNTFDINFRKGMYVDFRTDYDLTVVDKLTDKSIRKLTGEKPIKNLRHDVIKSEEFYTDTVRTCTAGGVVDTKTGEAAGFHFYDSLDNSKKTEIMLDNIFQRVRNPDRALVLGGKNLKISNYSMPIFKNILEGIKSRVPNVSFFEEHVFPFSESDLHYSIKNDTWTIHSMYRPLTDIQEFDVLTKEDLNKSFRKVKIANGDVLMFEGLS